MQTQYKQQHPHTNTIIDYCQQCECFHESTIVNGNIIYGSCEVKISQYFPTAEKIVTEKNLTSRTVKSESISSNSSNSNSSIKNHLLPTKKPNVIRQYEKSRNIQDERKSYRNTAQSIGSVKSSESSIYAKKHQIQALNINIKQNQKANQITYYRNQPNNALSSNFTQKHTFTQNPVSPHLLFPHTYIKPIPHTLHPHLPVIFQNISCIQTPEFGPSSIITQNHCNKISQSAVPKLSNWQKRRQVHQIKQIDEIILQDRSWLNDSIERTESLVEQDQYLCCGYIRKC